MSNVEKGSLGFAHALMRMLLALRSAPQDRVVHRSSGPGRHNPAGSKVLRQAYKEKHGRRGTYEESADWYRNLADGRYKAGHQRSVTGQPLKF